MKRLPLITSIVICLGAIATIVLNVVSCRSRAAGQPPAPPEPPKEQTPAEEAAAYTARLAKERMELTLKPDEIRLVADVGQFW